MDTSNPRESTTLVSVRLLVIAACAAGCGRFGFDVSGDGRADDGVVADDGTLGASNGDVSTGICPTTVAISDDFEDGTTAPIWTLLTGTNLSLTEAGGVMSVTFASNVPAGQTAGYAQTNPIDYTGACVIAELTEIPAAASGAYVEMRIGIGPTNNVQFEVDQGLLHSVSHNGAMIVRPDMRSWDLATQRFLRLRELGGTWYWEVSAEGAIYTTVASVPRVLVSQTSTVLELFAGSFSAASAAGRTAFASISVLVP